MEKNQAGKPISMRDLVDGKDYLVDYYAFFEVEQAAFEEAGTAASEELLWKPYRDKNMQYHPDRYTHLSPLMKSQAEHVHQSVVRGYGILKDPAKRSEYNQKLSEWKGPISTNGFPIYDKAFISSRDRRPMTEDEIQEFKGLMSDVAGYNPNTHHLLERLVASDKNDDTELREALDASLVNKEIFTAIEENYRWEQAGVTGHPFLESEAAAGYLDTVRTKVDEVRACVPAQASALLLEAQSGQLRLKAPDGSDQTELATTDPEVTLIKLIEVFLKPINDAAEHLERLAQEREANFIKRVELSMVYRPTQKVLRPKLIQCIIAKEHRAWQALKLTGERIVTDDSVDESVLPALELDVNEARRWVRRGWNIMYVTARDYLDLQLQSRQAILIHFQRYAKQEGLE